MGYNNRLYSDFKTARANDDGTFARKICDNASVVPLVRGLQFSLKNLKPSSTEVGTWLQKKLLEPVSIRRLVSLETNKILAKSRGKVPKMIPLREKFFKKYKLLLFM